MKARSQTKAISPPSRSQTVSLALSQGPKSQAVNPRSPNATDSSSATVRFGNVARGRPLVPEHRPPLGALGVVVGADLAVDVAVRDHRHILAREDVCDRVVVIGCGCVTSTPRSGLPERVEVSPKGAAVREQQRRSTATTPSSPSTR